GRWRRGRRWWSARPRCSATGSGGWLALARTGRGGATTAGGGILSGGGGDAGRGGLGAGGRGRGPARQEPPIAYRPGAARDPGAGQGCADRHAGGEPADRAVVDPGLDDPVAGRPRRAACAL